MANHSLVIFKKEVIKADTFLVVFCGVMTLLILIINNQGGVAQGFNAQAVAVEAAEAVESLKHAINLLTGPQTKQVRPDEAHQPDRRDRQPREVSREKKIKDTEASTGL